ncbi:MAG: hypothetical protein GX638_11650, partial [Crenarchaeota archaeon]|nr:hypothetical protein [Thermoproteota archaeon]
MEKKEFELEKRKYILFKKNNKFGIIGVKSGKQKEIIIKKLKDLLNTDCNLIEDDGWKKYIYGYCNKTIKRLSDIYTTYTSGAKLFKLLESPIIVNKDKIEKVKKYLNKTDDFYILKSKLEFEGEIIERRIFSQKRNQS